MDELTRVEQFIQRKLQTGASKKEKGAYKSVLGYIQGLKDATN